MQIEIAHRFQRAVRLDRDLSDCTALEGYVAVRSACDALVRLAEHVAQTRQRAFTWTGPYGGGKSSLALVLASLLGPDVKLRNRATEILGRAQTRRILISLSVDRKGWLVIPIVGERADIVPAIGDALRRAMVDRWGKQRAKVLLPQPVNSARDLLDAITRVTRAVERERDGVLLIIDEMGKLLEHAAASSGDIYFLQELAEIAARLDGRFVVVGVLHQAFEQYASRLRSNGREEWSKIQGRFIDIPLATGADEAIDLIGRAIVSTKAPASHAALVRLVANSVRARRPGVSKEIVARLTACWPLHPVVAGLLAAISRRRFGQNERSTFGFLNSWEPSGFQDYLRSADASQGVLYGPRHLWDYLRLNLEPAILASPDAHRWSEAVEAVERARNQGSSEHQDIAKAIALIDLFGQPVGLAADDDTLKTCLEAGQQGQLARLLADLKEWSVAIFRAHLGSWSLFAGSDFDIDSALTAARSITGTIDLSRLQGSAVGHPILAKRHYYATGTLRWFEPRITTLSDLAMHVDNDPPSSGASGTLLLVIPLGGETIDDVRTVCATTSKVARGYPMAIGLAPNASAIVELSREMSALEHIRAHETRLEGDAVARREVAGRIAAASSQLAALIQASFADADWFVDGKKLGRLGMARINQLVSRLADKAFTGAPIIRNELINRARPSSNAVKAQRMLMYRMLSDGTKAGLGIEGYPPERSLYASLLLASGIHQKDPDDPRFYKFDRPKGQQASASYLAIWDEAERFIQEAVNERKPLSDLYCRWTAPPYGLTAGVAPILALVFFLARESDLAFYFDGRFIPSMDELFVDNLLKVPDQVSVRRFEIAGVRRVTLERLAETVGRITDRRLPLEALGIAKLLVSFVRGLQPWTQRTNALTPQTRAVRDSILRADDPYRLLFEQLPAACGLPQLMSGPIDGSLVERYRCAVSQSLLELRAAYPEMLDAVRRKMLDALHVAQDNPDGYRTLAQRAASITGVSGDLRLDAFASRLRVLDESVPAMEGIAGLAANKPARDWIDTDVNRASLEVMDLCIRFQRAEALASAMGRATGTRSIAIVVGAGADTEAVIDTFSLQTKEQVCVSRLVQLLRDTLRAAEVEPKLQLAALAELGKQLIVAKKEAGHSSERADTIEHTSDVSKQWQH